MNIIVQAVKDGEIVEKRHWTNGRYTIGRNEICDMWLDNPHISSTHAKLDVDKNKVTVYDLHSKNGIYFNDEKIKNKKCFKKDFEIELGPYLLRGAFQKDSKPTFQQSTTFQNRIFANIRVLITMSLILMVVLASLTVFMVMNQQTRAFQKEELRKRGNLFSLYLAKLAETNAESITIDVKANLVVKHIASEEIVAWAVIADRTGQILAPQGMKSKMISWKGFEKAIQGRERKSENIANHQIIIFYPIKNDHRVLGGAVIQLDMRGASQSGMGVYFQMILFILICICLLVGRYITRFYLTPLNLLVEEVSVAMKTNRRGINFHSPHSEIAELVDMFNRLLQYYQRGHTNTEKPPEEDSTNIKSSMHDEYSGVNSKPKYKTVTKDEPRLRDESKPVRGEGKKVVSSPSDIPPQDKKAEIPSKNNQKTKKVVNTETPMAPGCQIDVNTLMITKCNRAFKEHFCQTGSVKQHNFSEVFEEPLISNAVYELLVGVEKEISVSISDTCAYLIQKRDFDDKKGLITIAFKEPRYE